MAVSLDGRIASHPDEGDHERQALGFTNDDDREHLLDLVRGADAVIVGASSLRASGGGVPDLVNRHGRTPIWAVLTNAGLPAATPLFAQTHLPRWLVSQTPPPQPVPAGAGDVRQLLYGDQPLHTVLFPALAAAGASRVLLFGGGWVNRYFYQEGLVDELILTLCPLIIGQTAALPLVQPALPAPVCLTLAASHSKGNLVFLNYKVQKPG